MNFGHHLRRELVTGKSGSGKSSLALHLLKVWPARWKFAFDPDREVARKLGWAVAIEQGEVIRLASQFRPVAFDPIPMFRGETDRGLDWFCGLVLRMSRKVHGVKVLYVDEIWKHTGRVLPVGLKEVLHAGRREEIDSLFVSQQLNDTNATLRAQVTKLWAFRQSDRRPLEWLEEAGFDPDQISALAYPGGFVVKDDLKGTFHRGRTQYSGVPVFAASGRGATPALRKAQNSPAK